MISKKAGTQNYSIERVYLSILTTDELLRHIVNKHLKNYSGNGIEIAKNNRYTNNTDNG